MQTNNRSDSIKSQQRLSEYLHELKRAKNNKTLGSSLDARSSIANSTGGSQNVA